MLDQTIVTYCICDEVVKSMNVKENQGCKMSTAEVMTFAILSAQLFGCDYRKTRLITLHQKYFPKILSHSQLVRRIHQIPELMWRLCLAALQLVLRNKISSKTPLCFNKAAKIAKLSPTLLNEKIYIDQKGNVSIK